MPIRAIAALATALAKAQIELANPEKSLTGIIEAQDGEGRTRQFRYAPLSSGLEIVRTLVRKREFEPMAGSDCDHKIQVTQHGINAEIAASFLALNRANGGAFERLNRYETALRRQVSPCHP